MFGKFTDSLTASTNYLVQVEKMGNEKRAQELGISSRELKGLSQEQAAAKFGMTLQEYQDKVARDAEQYNNNNLMGSAQAVQERAQVEAEARERQAAFLGMDMQAFNELTLQEQADRLNISLDQLLEERALRF